MNGKQLLRIVVAVAGLASAVHSSAQEATERYIPIGQSPGLSGGETYLGQCVDYDPAEHLLQVEGAAGKRSVHITEETRIWLDRSKMRETNLVGAPTDLLPGRRIEVKYADPHTREVADWIKVEVVE